MSGSPAERGPAAERIRPCLRCGALMPFSGQRCGACGATVAEAPGSVREPEGAKAGAEGDPAVDERVRPCAACNELISFEPSYCPACGELAVALPSDSIPQRVELDPPGRALDGLPDWVGGLVFAAGLVALWVAAVEILD